MNFSHSGIRLKSFRSFAIFYTLFSFSVATGSVIPRPDHVVICILENHRYSQIIGSPDAPYINSLVPQAANLQEFYALTHPSQPNYIMMFSGSDQGETSDNLPAGTPWITPNLGAALLMTGYTFGAYSEDLPTIGSTVAYSGAYARKHCPWVNWQGNGPNQIPAICHMPMTHFPSNFSHLPDLSFVIPNQNNDMHNGTDPGRIITGDAWLESYLKAYIDWTYHNNSLFILVFDEDDFTPVNKIPCLFIGPMIQPGDYSLIAYDHYDLLRTLMDMFILPLAGNAANAMPILEIWKIPTAEEYFIGNSITAKIYPNPVNTSARLSLSDLSTTHNEDIYMMIFDVEGRLKQEEIFHWMDGHNEFPISIDKIGPGLYTYILKNKRQVLSNGKFVVN